MKKIRNLLLIAAVVLGIPASVMAKSYTALNLEETLTREKIEHDLSDYKESSDQITIYMFRGDRCGHCQNFLKFLNDNVKEYGQYFKLKSFEIWHNENNAALMSEVADHFGKEVKGVPFIIIGDKTFQGYNTSYNEEILKTITNYYNNKNTYKDVVSSFLVIKEESTIGAAITILVLISAIAGSGFLIYMAKGETSSEEKKEEAETVITNEKKNDNKNANNASLKEPKQTKTPTLPKLKETKTNGKEEVVKVSTVSKSKSTTAKNLPKKKETTTKKTTSTNKQVPKTSAKKNTATKKSASQTTTKKTTTKKSTTNKTNTTKKNKASEN